MAADHLFRFIKTLSKNEKVYIKRNAALHQIGEGNKYIKLFDALCDLRKYDEEALRKSFADDPFFNNFSSAKNYLFNFILHSLESYHKSPRAELGSLLHQAEILFEKGMHDQCLKKVLKAEGIARKYELESYFYEIILWKTNLRRPAQDEEAFRRSNESFRKEMRDNLHRLQMIVEDDFENFDLIREVMFLGGKAKEERLENLKKFDLFLSELQDKENEIKESASFALRFGHYQKLNILHQIQNRPKERMYYLNKGVALFLEHPHMMEVEPYFYVFLFYLREKFVLELKHYQYSSLLEGLRLLEEIDQQNSSRKNLLEFFTCRVRFGICFGLGKFETARQYASRLNRFFGSVDLYELFSLERKVFLMESAVMELVTKNYKASLQLIEEVLESSNREVRSDVYFFAQVFQLIVHYEKGDHEVIEYRARSVYRFLSLKKGVNRTEKLLLDFFRTETTSTSEKSRAASFIKLREDYLGLLDENPEEALSAISFQLGDWMQSKIEGRSLAEVLQDKHKDLLKSSEGQELIAYLEEPEASHQPRISITKP